MIEYFDMIAMEHCTMMTNKKTERSCKEKKIEDLKICSIDKRVFGYCQSNSWSSNVSSVFFILKMTIRRRKASRTRPHFAKMKSSQPVLRIIVILKMFNVPWSDHCWISARHAPFQTNHLKKRNHLTRALGIWTNSGEASPPSSATRMTTLTTPRSNSITFWFRKRRQRRSNFTESGD